MSTDTTGSDARDFGRQVMHYLRRDISFDTPNISTDATIKVGTIPAGSVIHEAVVKVSTAFNAGTTNLINVGISSDADGIVDELDIDATAAEWQSSHRGSDLNFTSDTSIYVTYVQTGTAATAGAASIIIAYVPDNDL